VETSSHLFLHCRVIFKVWLKILSWLEINFITPHNLYEHFERWSGEIQNKKLCKGSCWCGKLLFGWCGMIGFLRVMLKETKSSRFAVDSTIY